MRLVLLLLLCLSPAAVAAPDEFRAPKHGVYVIAHRGAHVGIPENTAAAARKAIELGADFIEIDVRTTKDGKIAVVHNATVDAYTENAKGRVKDFTLDELKALDIGTRVGPQWKEERIPTFEELLDICQGKIGVYLDVKDARIEDLLPPHPRARHGARCRVVRRAGLSGEAERSLPGMHPHARPGHGEDAAKGH
jgi:glycerophosphoryl diester phosphodiesterase